MRTGNLIMFTCLAGVLLILTSCTTGTKRKEESSNSFRSFHRRALGGEHLNVVFFGASLTWGANATAPEYTSYRAQTAKRFEEAYPKAHFKFFDGAIGGTGSQLGVFRLDRDCLRHEPDLVFLDFTANDGIGHVDPETLASYESLIRRLVAEAKVPVVQMIFPFLWDVKWENGEFKGKPRRDAHYEISRAYQTPVGDAVKLCYEQVKTGRITIEEIWPVDGVHPGDEGYKVFAEAAWEGYQMGVDEDLICRAPAKMLHADTYMTLARIRISSLGRLPEGWSVDRPNLVSAWYDAKMSRWLDDVVIASNRKTIKDEDGKDKEVPANVKRLKVKINAAAVLLFGEETLISGKYRTYLDGKLMEHEEGDRKVTELDACSKKYGGNRHLTKVIVTGLDTGIDHVLEIEPVLDEEQELRLESICVAGGKAKVWLLGD